MNLFSSYVAENTNNRLEYGIHENVVIKKVETEPRKKQDGSIMKVSMFITYTKVDTAGAPLAEIEEFVFWPKHDSKIGPTKAIIHYTERLSEILKCHYPAVEVNAAFDAAFNALNIEGEDLFTKHLSIAANMKALTNSVNSVFVAAATPLMGLKSPYQYRLKVGYQDDGRGVEVPNNNFIEPMAIPVEQSVLNFKSQRDIRAKMEAEKPKAATNLGATPGAPGAMAIPGMPGMPAGVPGMPSGVPAGVVPAGIPGMPVATATIPTIPGVAPVAASVQGTVVTPAVTNPLAGIPAPGQIAMPFLASPVV